MFFNQKMKISVNLAQFFVVLVIAICLIPAVVILGIILALKQINIFRLLSKYFK